MSKFINQLILNIVSFQTKKLVFYHLRFFPNMDQTKSTLNLLHAKMLVSEICAKFNALKSTIYYVEKNFEMMGKIIWHNRKQKAEMGAKVAKSKIELKNDPFKSIWQVAWELQIYHRRVSEVIKLDMRAKSNV